MSRRVASWAWDHLALVGYGVLALVLAGFEPGYNHVFAACLVLTLGIFALKLWFGSYSPFGLVAGLAHLGVCLSMLWTGNADVVPYFGILLCLSMAAVALGRLLVTGPLPLTSPERVAENYLDSGLGVLVATAGGVLGWLWMPKIRYIVVPIVLLFAFQLARPVRRRLLPVLLRAVGLSPTDGPTPRPVCPVIRGYSPAKGAAMAALGLVATSVAVPLLATTERYDVSMPRRYSLPPSVTAERRSVLEARLADEAGLADVDSMVELGRLLHKSGLEDAAFLERARSVLERALELAPDHPAALAAHGTNEAAFAIYEWHPVRRFQLVERGKASVDRAVELAPADAAIRLARVDLFLAVPRMFRLRRFAEEDLELLLEWSRSRPERVAGLLTEIHQRAGDLSFDQGRVEEARSHWRRALDLLPRGSYEFRRIATQLAELRAQNLPTEAEG